MKLLTNRRGAAAAAVTAVFLVPLGVFGAPALARTAASASEYQYSGSSQYQYKVQICHHTHSKKHPTVQIKVSSSAVKAHLKHGDTLGTCAPTTAPAKKNHGKHKGQAPSTTTSSHGKSGEHGNGKDK